jgi:hypothetical protein
MDIGIARHSFSVGGSSVNDYQTHYKQVNSPSFEFLYNLNLTLI